MLLLIQRHLVLIFSAICAIIEIVVIVRLYFSREGVKAMNVSILFEEAEDWVWEQGHYIDNEEGETYEN